MKECVGVQHLRILHGTMKNMVINVCNKILIVEKEFSCNFMFVYSNQRENHENVY